MSWAAQRTATRPRPNAATRPKHVDRRLVPAAGTVGWVPILGQIRVPILGQIRVPILGQIRVPILGQIRVSYGLVSRWVSSW